MTAFHNGADLASTAYEPLNFPTERIRERTLSYTFRTHFHPYVTELTHRLVTGSIDELQDADTAQPPLRRTLMTDHRYEPTELVAEPYPVAELDFTISGGYAVYNWELFFHLPLTAAMHLSRNGRYEEAQRWFHYIFDPTDDSDDPAPERFWKVQPFRTTDVESITEILTNLSTGADQQLLADTVSAISSWADQPFSPHVVARYRPTAYMLKTVMAYLDNLVAWGDSLFRQDTGEAINEATQLYVLAANLLGPRPEKVPPKGLRVTQTYRSLRGDLDVFSNAVREIEADLPFDLAPAPTPVSDEAPLSTVTGIGSTLYFCVPRNDTLLGYWDTVADRLFKIRNSLTIEGVFRQLPLFDPPIDPGMLARATAAGLNVAAVLSGLNQPLPLVRFRSLVAKAGQLCQEVRGLGAQLLSAIEKKDAETLGVLRARQERQLLELAETVKYEAWQEAVKSREALEASLSNAYQRYRHYQRLLGVNGSALTEPELDALDTDAMDRARFSSQEPANEVADASVTISPLSPLVAAGHQLTPDEAAEMLHLQSAQAKQNSAEWFDRAATFTSLIPDFKTHITPFGVGMAISFGGTALTRLSNLKASMDRSASGKEGYLAGQSARIAGYDRREQDWTLQSTIAAGELNATLKQLRAAQIREDMAHRDYTNHQQAIRNAADIERFLTDSRTGKITNEAFYLWLKRETRGLYQRCFQLAYDTARKAERALQHELGDPNRTFLRYDYRGGKEELLAGEKLYLDVTRMELAYADLNRREYELTKHVSLRQLDPRALIELRTTGQCTIDVGEAAFDLDAPGHYFRRLRGAAVTIPCVAGPYASVNCTLTLLSSSVRTSPAVDSGSDAGYDRATADDSRFSDYFGVQSIVTSSASDSGLFDSGGGDDRYLPFEGSGAVSQWRLELPSDVPQFDHDTISDVVLHLHYTAREGGAALRSAAVAALQGRIAAAAAVGSTRLLSVRHEFPTEWARFVATAPTGLPPTAPLTLTLREEHYPYWSRLTTDRVLHALELFASAGDADVTVYDAAADNPPGSRHETLLRADPSVGDLRSGLLVEPLPPALGPLTLYLDDSTITDLWIALTWGAAA
ncbi:insecticidal toxin protein [Micromonospora orduensis]|uniref:Insecticidal toxin protein n=1 Tax=Micromonospora orduensis TaxID=1420891 RepID=A0A5C4QQI2_9ACTN|nr:insecticidal toxin protein [Micromonospora orduensis]TNH27808.1 insecticidal toxin protein [Micromonospora orduensis]